MSFRQFLAVACLFTPTAALAQTTCDILAENLRQDVLVQGSTANLFSEHKKVICTEANKSWGGATDKSFNGSLTVPRYVDLVIGTSSTEQNWQSSYDRFCGLDAGTVAADQDASLEVRQASVQAYDAIVRCVREYGTYADRLGIFGVLSVTPHRDGFSIFIRHRTDGASDWAVLGVRPTPIPAGFECDEGFHEASSQSPKAVKQATWTITCRKDPATPIQVAVNTTAGALPVFEVQGLNDRLRGIEDRLTVVESRLVPAGTLAWFAESACPSGWEAYADARGRTIVGAGNEQNKDANGAVVSRWTLGQTGGEETRTLKLEELPPHRHDVVGLFKLSGYALPGTTNQAVHPGPAPAALTYPVKTTNVGGGRPYNNMPPFVALTPCMKQ